MQESVIKPFHFGISLDIHNLLGPFSVFYLRRQSDCRTDSHHAFSADTLTAFKAAVEGWVWPLGSNHPINKFLIIRYSTTFAFIPVQPMHVYTVECSSINRGILQTNMKKMMKVLFSTQVPTGQFAQDECMWKSSFKSS